MLLNRQQILKVSKRVFTQVGVPECGEGAELRLASLAAGPALAVNALKDREAKGEDVNRQVMLILLESAVVDEEGKPFFDAATAAQFLDTVSQETLMQVVNAIPGLKATTPPPSEASPAAV